MDGGRRGIARGPGADLPATAPVAPGVQDRTLGPRTLEIPMATRFERLCRSCYQHRALYRVRGGHVARYSPDHPLCFRCWRSLIDHERARQLAEREAAPSAGRRAG